MRWILQALKKKLRLQPDWVTQDFDQTDNIEKNIQRLMLREGAVNYLPYPSATLYFTLPCRYRRSDTPKYSERFD